MLGTWRRCSTAMADAEPQGGARREFSGPGREENYDELGRQGDRGDFSGRSAVRAKTGASFKENFPYLMSKDWLEFSQARWARFQPQEKLLLSVSYRWITKKG